MHQEARLDHFRATRRRTAALAAGLDPEDCALQSMPEASPVKWHLAHTTWFFETFVLRPHARDYAMLDPRYEMLFNSYYNSVGAQYPRPRRGLLSRPTLAEVLDYRRHVDAALEAFVEHGEPAEVQAASAALLLGIHHEEQHQELILTDVKHALAQNPLEPAYRAAQRKPAPPDGVPGQGWVEHPGGVVEIGHAGDGFAFDNEGPRHAVALRPFELANRLVTCAEYLEFMDDGGYRKPELWLSDGWDACLRHGWKAPLYWRRDGRAWLQATLDGTRRVGAREPVCHVSFYEADAYARWRALRDPGLRLPLEAEWEVVAAEHPVAGNLADAGALHPVPLARAPEPGRAAQLWGDAWEWTASPYVAYPGYVPLAGAFGEYNGKFMSNQMVLRGGSCATPVRHVRATYRNFFPPETRWQFSGIRLAR